MCAAIGDLDEFGSLPGHMSELKINSAKKESPAASSEKSAKSSKSNNKKTHAM